MTAATSFSANCHVWILFKAESTPYRKLQFNVDINGDLSISESIIGIKHRHSPGRSDNPTWQANTWHIAEDKTNHFSFQLEGLGRFAWRYGFIRDGHSLLLISYVYGQSQNIHDVNL